LTASTNWHYFTPQLLGDAVRVTIEHREEAAGFSGQKRNYFVDCTVDLSEEEKAIISARGLQKHFITVPPAEPPRTAGAFMGAGALRGFGPIIAVAGFIFGLFGGGVLAGLMLFGGLGMVAWGFMSDTKDKFYGDQTITLGRLVTHPNIRVWSPNPANAKSTDQSIREQLANLKENLKESAAIPAKQTFEL